MSFLMSNRAIKVSFPTRLTTKKQMFKKYKADLASGGSKEIESTLDQILGPKKQ